VGDLFHNPQIYGEDAFNTMISALRRFIPRHLSAAGLFELLQSALVGFASVLFARTGSSRTAPGALIFAAILLFAKFAVIIFIAVTPALVSLVCHRMLLYSAEFGSMPNPSGASQSPTNFLVPAIQRELKI
jgi:hypothetical protein